MMADGASWIPSTLVHLSIREWHVLSFDADVRKVCGAWSERQEAWDVPKYRKGQRCIQYNIEF